MSINDLLGQPVVYDCVRAARDGIVELNITMDRMAAASARVPPQLAPSSRLRFGRSKEEDDAVRTNIYNWQRNNWNNCVYDNATNLVMGHEPGIQYKPTNTVPEPGWENEAIRAAIASIGLRNDQPSTSNDGGSFASDNMEVEENTENDQPSTSNDGGSSASDKMVVEGNTENDKPGTSQDRILAPNDTEMKYMENDVPCTTRQAGGIQKRPKCKNPYLVGIDSSDDSDDDVDERTFATRLHTASLGEEIREQTRKRRNSDQAENNDDANEGDRGAQNSVPSVISKATVLDEAGCSDATPNTKPSMKRRDSQIAGIEVAHVDLSSKAVCIYEETKKPRIAGKSNGSISQVQRRTQRAKRRSNRRNHNLAQLVTDFPAVEFLFYMPCPESKLVAEKPVTPTKQEVTLDRLKGPQTDPEPRMCLSSSEDELEMPEQLTDAKYLDPENLVLVAGGYIEVFALPWAMGSEVSGANIADTPSGFSVTPTKMCIQEYDSVPDFMDGSPKSLMDTDNFMNTAVSAAIREKGLNMKKSYSTKTIA